MGCNDRYEENEEQVQRREIEERKEKQERARETKIREEAEATWATFVNHGLKGLDADVVEAQKRRVLQRHKLLERETQIKKELEAIDKERREISMRCIHLTSLGTSAFDGGIYDICCLCGDMR